MKNTQQTQTGEGNAPRECGYCNGAEACPVCGGTGNASIDKRALSELKSGYDQLLEALRTTSSDLADAVMWINSDSESLSRRLQGVSDMIERSRELRYDALMAAAAKIRQDLA